jgi:hypothetical protein
MFIGKTTGLRYSRAYRLGVRGQHSSQNGSAVRKRRPRNRPLPNDERKGSSIRPGFLKSAKIVHRNHLYRLSETMAGYLVRSCVTYW